MKYTISAAALSLFLLSLADPTTAFLPIGMHSSTRSSTAQHAFWRNSDDATRNDEKRNTLAATIVMAIALTCSSPAWAVSGGGLDYANIDISGQDFGDGSYKGKDFTQVIAKNTNFAKSNLQGCRFYKAYLVNTNFEAADLRGASLEDTSMDGANMKDAIAVGSYFSKSILDVASVENADFTDAQFPLKTQPLLCLRNDLTGTNPVTGADTRESAMCP